MFTEKQDVWMVSFIKQTKTKQNFLKMSCYELPLFFKKYAKDALKITEAVSIRKKESIA